MKELRTWHWLAAAVVAALLAAPCVGLALRAMERHEFKRAIGVSARNSFMAPPIEVKVLRHHIAEYRRLILMGRYDHEHEVLIRGREHAGEPGFYVVTPLQVKGGAFLVLRGWIPLASGDAEGLAGLHEPGDVRVEGIPLPPEPASEEPGSVPEALDGWPLELDAFDPKLLRERLPYAISGLLVQQLRTAGLAERPRRLSVPQLEDPSHRRKANALYLAAAVLAGLPFAALALYGRRA